MRGLRGREEESARLEVLPVLPCPRLAKPGPSSSEQFTRPASRRGICRRNGFCSTRRRTEAAGRMQRRVGCPFVVGQVRRLDFQTVHPRKPRTEEKNNNNNESSVSVSRSANNRGVRRGKKAQGRAMRCSRGRKPLSLSPPPGRHALEAAAKARVGYNGAVAGTRSHWLAARLRASVRSVPVSERSRRPLRFVQCSFSPSFQVGRRKTCLT